MTRQQHIPMPLTRQDQKWVSKLTGEFQIPGNMPLEIEHAHFRKGLWKTRWLSSLIAQAEVAGCGVLDSAGTKTCCGEDRMPCAFFPLFPRMFVRLTE